MSIHLYCVLPHESRGEIPPGLSGVAGARVRALPVDHLIAWVSDVARDVRVTVDGVRAHDAVVEAALDTGSTPVPARFGQRFESDRACTEALINRAESVELILAGLQGFVEMTVIITPSTRRMLRDMDSVIPKMLDSEHGAGRSYLETLRAREAKTGTIHRAMDDLADRIATAADRFVRRWTVHQASTPLPLRTVSHLIAREDQVAYQAALKAVQGNAELRFIVVGPR
ncbi:MAG TPA: GvpL/GvpF family gas vesicle protein, partial [Gemmatimonadaceae bacterium]|nr:GvpL/GvpF family gas vesicle protein [Gemmatimonadaceae bacterium]